MLTPAQLQVRKILDSVLVEKLDDDAFMDNFLDTFEEQLADNVPFVFEDLDEVIRKTKGIRRTGVWKYSDDWPTLLATYVDYETIVDCLIELGISKELMLKLGKQLLSAKRVVEQMF